MNRASTAELKMEIAYLPMTSPADQRIPIRASFDISTGIGNVKLPNRPILISTSCQSGSMPKTPSIRKSAVEHCFRAQALELGCRGVSREDLLPCWPLH